MKPSFKNGYLFCKYLFAVEMRKTEIKMKKPVYLGQAILDPSRALMYEIHYDYMRLKYGSKVKLCYMNTNSFVYKIGTKNFCRNFAKHMEKCFNASEYSKYEHRPLLI